MRIKIVWSFIAVFFLASLHAVAVIKFDLAAGAVVTELQRRKPLLATAANQYLQAKHNEAAEAQTPKKKAWGHAPNYLQASNQAPHVTVIQFKNDVVLNEDNKKKINDILKEVLVAHQDALECETSNLKVLGQANRFITYEVLSASLTALEQKLREKLALSGFGVEEFKGFFEPHISVVRITQDNFEKTLGTWNTTTVGEVINQYVTSKNGSGDPLLLPLNFTLDKVVFADGGVVLAQHSIALLKLSKGLEALKTKLAELATQLSTL
ncbi:2'-5' RNA ligase family protein [Candidatus Babeliales bacterium]|nr:2'-5' RNA ligase family protein [Candidatus Babeliales bacterium]